MIVEQLKQLPSVANSEIVVKDFSDEWIAEYLKENNVEALPLFVFSTNNFDVSKDPSGTAQNGQAVPKVNTFLEEMSSWEYTLLVWSSFNPFAEICDNGVDDNEDGQIDCDDSTCGGNLLCREETKWTLDVFLMGYCPYGEIAAKAIPQMQEVLKAGMDLDVHFIATKIGEWDTADSFQSLHGVPEAEEDIRQLCIKKHYGVETLVSYFQTRYENADNTGKVTDEPILAYDANNIDAEKITSCVENGEWAKLLEEDIKIAQGLWIGGSPTWLANNKYQFGWIQANDIITNFCKYNSDIEGCDVELEEVSDTTWWTDPSCN